MLEEWLPPGWTVEIKFRKNGKRDWATAALELDKFRSCLPLVLNFKESCYFNPSKERKFKSKPEVLRYLKSIENIPDSKGKRRSSRNLSSLDSSVRTKQARIANSGVNGQKINKQHSRPSNTLKNVKTLESCPGAGKTSALVKEKNKLTNGVRDSATVPKSPLQNENMAKMEKNGIKRVQIGNDNKIKNKNEKVELPRRASKRLAGAEIGPIPDLIPNAKTRKISARKVDDINIAKTKNLLGDSKKTSNEDNGQSESPYMPKRHSIDKSDDVTGVSIDKSDDVSGVSSELPMQDLWNDPCINFAIKTLMGQIPIEEKGYDKPFIEAPGPCKESNLGDLWADPCIQFAVKTLTGDIDIPIHDPSSQDFFPKMDKGLDFPLGLGSASKKDGFPQNDQTVACTK